MIETHQFEEVAKQDTFRDLYKKIEPLIAEEKYSEARREIQEELKLFAESLGGSVGDSLVRIREEFEAFVPEDIRWLLSTETPEARARVTKKRAEELSAQEEARKIREGANHGGSDVAKESVRNVPAFDEIRPGLILEIEGPGETTLEIVGDPYKKKEDPDWRVDVSDQMGNRYPLVLADKGIVPYSNGTWNDVNRPVKWYRKENIKQ